MKIFIDSADTYAIAKAFDTGLVDGVTTNPTLIMKSGRTPEDVYDELVAMGVPDISMEVYGTADEMIAEGMRLSKKYGPAATIKVPMTKDGLDACAELSRQLIRVNVTLIFCIPQAILAAKAGATYVSPFVGRLDRVRTNPLQGWKSYVVSLACTHRKEYTLKCLLHQFAVFTELSAPGTTAHTQ